MNTFYIVIGACILWSIWGYVSPRVEITEYTVIEKKNEYEIRLYPAHIVAQTTVTGSYRDALNQGFRIVAGYIFGGNVKKERIAMIAPVVEKSATSESIAMTAPVVASIEGEAHVIAFGMPKSYTLDTLPAPTDTRVQIVSIPEKKMAVIRFAWMRSDPRVQEKKLALLSALEKEGVEVAGDPQYAGYNAPWTPPWMSRHEVMVEVK